MYLFPNIIVHYTLPYKAPFVFTKTAAYSNNYLSTSLRELASTFNLKTTTPSDASTTHSSYRLARYNLS
jgi:hypothetical protein